MKRFESEDVVFFMEARATTATQVISPFISLSFLLRRFFFLCVGRANDAPIYYQPSAEQAEGTKRQNIDVKNAPAIYPLTPTNCQNKTLARASLLDIKTASE